MKPKLILCLALVLHGGLVGCSTVEWHDSANVAEPCNPHGKLVLSGQTLYGTTSSGGFTWAGESGAIFKVNTNGTCFAVLHHFSPITYPTFTNKDGASPMAGLILAGHVLYGTASGGGGAGCGTVFKVKTNGRDFTVLHTFKGSDGARPLAALVLSGNALFGTTQRGGHNEGVVFKINTDGTGFAVLHTFSASGCVPGHYATYANSDGSFSQSGLILSGNILYGTAWSGGPGEFGTIFKVNTDGTDFAVLHAFAKPMKHILNTGHIFNTDGAVLEAGLLVSGNSLYGIASEGGEAGNGTVFKVNTDGSDFAVLHGFTATYNGRDEITNIDGAMPKVLILSGKTFYGLTSDGGERRRGTLFKLNSDGTGFSTLPGFDNPKPIGSLILSDKAFYGTTPFGGSKGGGIVFKVNTDGTGFIVLHRFIEKPPPPGIAD
jgi:uncharacterized repeat protein (TIGR03803 family)